MSTTAPLDVPVAVTPGTALWVQHLDRAGAEAALSAAAAADPTVVRWLAHPKGADTVLSLLIPSTPKFFHEKIVANPDGIFACAVAQGKAVASMLALCSRVAEALRIKFNRRCRAGTPRHRPWRRRGHLRLQDNRLFSPFFFKIRSARQSASTAAMQRARGH